MSVPLELKAADLQMIETLLTQSAEHLGDDSTSDALTLRVGQHSAESMDKSIS
jgi:hypothetical protein